MFRKLHRQMTLFCTAVTSTILVVLTVLCLFIAEKSLTQNSYASFLNETSSIISHLQKQDTISLQWINQLREKNNFESVLFDNGSPLFSQRLTMSETILGKDFINLAMKTAKETYDLDIFSNDGDHLSTHTEFSLSRNKKDPYYICVGKIPKANGQISFIFFYSLENQQQQILKQRIAFALADIAGILLLAVFSYFFTDRMLFPLEENNRKQTQFIASASHELRTPLAVILSGLEALEKSKEEQDRHHFANLMQQEGLRMQRLISDMLLLANSDANSLKIQPVSCQPDELMLCVYEKYELLAAQKKISLKLHLPETSLPDILCDTERILQVLSILLDNALSYTPVGGTVTLSVNNVSDIPLPKSATVLFQVSDTGSGVPDADKKHIFERFYRAESSHTDKEHFGLGLCIAKEIVDAHHGKIGVTDAPEGGACFFVAL